jgi:hypothetical protein
LELSSRRKVSEVKALFDPNVQFLKLPYGTNDMAQNQTPGSPEAVASEETGRYQALTADRSEAVDGGGGPHQEIRLQVL